MSIERNMENPPHQEYMREAIRRAEENVRSGHGGPFGAVIVKEGVIIASVSNRVTESNDPTAHAEIVAIRAACTELQTFDLSGCEIYASCEPCPMCLGAILWSRLDRLYYAADRFDAARAGFDDELFYRELALEPSERSLQPEQMLQTEAVGVFDLWNRTFDKQAY
jgi:guanine deaminase